MVVLRILHVVAGILAVFHGVAAFLLDKYFAHSKPTTANYATGETYRWETSEYTRNSWHRSIVVYITDYEAAVWHAAIVVTAVSVLISAAAYLVLKLDARRNGRTSIF